VKPSRIHGLEGYNSVGQVMEEERADIQNEVTEAKWVQEQLCEGGDSGDLPTLKVGNWTFCANIGVLNCGTHCIANCTSISFGTATDHSCSSQSVLVAMKTVSKDSDEESIQMMRQECRILQQLGSSHPHILPMIYYVDLPSEIVLLTPFAPAGDLSHHVPSGSCLSECEARKLMLQLFSGLAYLHGTSTIHGDVKPQNILLTELTGAYLAQLADFGLSVQVPAGETSVKVDCVQGSYGFIPTEMIEAKEASFGLDLFALGVVLFRILAAYDPFYPASQVQVSLEFDPICWSPLSLEAKLVVEQLLAPSTEARGRAEELLETHPWLLAAEDALAGSPPRDSAAPQPSAEVCFHDLPTARRLWDQKQGCERASTS